MNTFIYLQITLIFVLAGVVKGISGMGLPTLSMALLTLIMPTSGAAALMLIPSLVTNAAQCLGPHFRRLCKALWPMWFTLLLATIFSPLPDVNSAGTEARLALGTVLVLYGAAGLLRPALPDLRRWAGYAGILAGTTSGLLTASTGIFVMPMVPFLQSQKLKKAEMMQALGISFSIATVALTLRLGITSALPLLFQPIHTGVALVTALFGLWLGARIRDRLNQLAFQRALHVVFISLGSITVWKAL